MPRRKLTQLAVDALNPPAAGRVDYFDALLPGFGLRISAIGTKSWFVFYRFGGRLRRYTIGTLATHPKVDEARRRAREVMQAVERGEDPAETKAGARSKQADTVRAVTGTFIERYAKPKNRSWRTTERLLEMHIVSRWGDRDIKSITRRDVIEALDELVDRGFPTAANRVLAAVRKMFAWAVERDILPASPAQNVRAPSKETQRERVLTDDELTAIWRAAAEQAWAGGVFIRVLILTGQRRDEVAGMRWVDLDLDARVWTLPREMTKGDRVHEVPLSLMVVELLQARPHHGPFVFTTRGERPISGYSKLKAQIDQASGVAGWRLHDLRRTCGTGLARLGVPRSTISRVLNHAEGGVTAIYDRYGYLDEKRAALDLWAGKVRALVEPQPAKVLPFRGAARAG